MSNHANYPHEIRCQSADPIPGSDCSYELPCSFCQQPIKIHLNGIATLRSRCGHYSHITTVDSLGGKILVEFHRKESHDR